MDFWGLLILAILALAAFFFIWGLACLLPPWFALTVAVLIATLPWLWALWGFLGSDERVQREIEDRIYVAAAMLPLAIGFFVGSRWPKRVKR